MTVYWLMLLYFAAGALLIPADWQRTSNANPFFWFGAIAIVILIGFRYWIGGDWPQYERIFSFAGYASLSQVIFMGDPGYQVLNWVARRLGLDRCSRRHARGVGRRNCGDRRHTHRRDWPPPHRRLAAPRPPCPRPSCGPRRCSW